MDALDFFVADPRQYERLDRAGVVLRVQPGLGRFALAAALSALTL
jgi:hypothetical protein